MHIVKHPHKSLTTQSRTVHQDEYPEIIELADEAQELMEENQGVGIAANQVDDQRRWFIIKGIGLCINPSWEPTPSSRIKKTVEGCLSMPGKEFKKKRHRIIRAKWTNQRGEQRKKVLRRIEAIAFQHETDHLNGVNIWD